MFISQNWTFSVCDCRSKFPFYPFPFVFPGYFNLVLSACHIFPAAVKSLVLVMGKAWKWELDQLQVTIFAPKLITALNLLRKNAHDIKSKNDCCADRSILALLSARQECLVTLKSMTSRVV